MKEIPFQSMTFNPMTMIGEEWMLIAAGNEQNGYNAMTASWGHLGAIWDRPDNKLPMGLPTAVIYIRPQRYTKEFVDREGIFTLSVFDGTYKKALSYLGAHSGRDGDKIAHVGLTPMFTEGTVCFAEAKTTLICRKLYHATLLESGFFDPTLVKACYPNKDFHEMYVGEILRVLVAD